MAQLVIRVPDEVAEAIDRLVERGLADSRSAAVRRAIDDLLDRERRARLASEIVDGYRSRPQSEDEVAWSDAATVAMIGEESW